MVRDGEEKDGVRWWMWLKEGGKRSQQSNICRKLFDFHSIRYNESLFLVMTGVMPPVSPLCCRKRDPCPATVTASLIALWQHIVQLPSQAHTHSSSVICSFPSRRSTDLATSLCYRRLSHHSHIANVCPLLPKPCAGVPVAATAFKAEWQNRGCDCVGDLYMLTGHPQHLFRAILHPREEQREKHVVILSNTLNPIDDVFSWSVRETDFNIICQQKKCGALLLLKGKFIKTDSELDGESKAN